MSNLSKKKKNISSGMNVGSSSILVTFVLLCLVTFAALSFVSANADNRLAKATGDRVSAYYSAKSLAEVNLANIDSLLTKHAKVYDEEEYFDKIEELFKDNSNYSVTMEADNTYIHYEIPATANQDLCVTLKVVYPSRPTADCFIITEWENVSTYVPSETDTINEEKGGLLF